MKLQVYNQGISMELQIRNSVKSLRGYYCNTISPGEITDIQYIIEINLSIFMTYKILTVSKCFKSLEDFAVSGSLRTDTESSKWQEA